MLLCVVGFRGPSFQINFAKNQTYPVLQHASLYVQLFYVVFLKSLCSFSKMIGQTIKLVNA